jgi:hypothetical protein
MIRYFTVPLFFCLFFLTSCNNYYLSLRQMPVDASYLASASIGSPDPRTKNPPYGQKIILQWRVPTLANNPQLVFTIVYKNHTEKKFVYPIQRTIGYEVYSLLNKDYDETGGVLTYRAEIVGEDNTVLKEWKHQLWVNLITLDETSQASNEVPPQPALETDSGRQN